MYCFLFLSYDIIIITETWFSNINDAEFGLAGHQLYRLKRSLINSPYSRGGGVLIAINLLIKSSVHFTSDNVEKVFIILLLNTNTLLVGVVYIPPNTRFFVIESHVSIIEEILSP